MKWTVEKENELKAFYPSHGKKWCVDNLGLTEAQVRQKASRLNLKQDRNSEFFYDWQKRAAKSKVGKKRPEQALVIKKLHEDGKIIQTEKQKEENILRLKNFIKNNPHPIGMTGKKHSSETKEIISKKSIKFWENMPKEQREEFSVRASINGSKVAASNREKATWKAGWREFGGKRKYYRSRWEANYGRYLEWLKEKGQIKDWLHEPETFWFEGIKRGCMSYLPDFKVIENDNSFSFHEVKGWMDDRSKTKIKRMAKYHPEINLIVIDTKNYKKIERDVKNIIKEWEE